MSEILNDENVMAELQQKVKDYEQEAKDLEQKIKDLEQEQKDLAQKKLDYGEGLSEEMKEQIDVVINKVNEKILEVGAQIVEKSEKIKEIQSEMLNAPEVPVPPAQPVLPVEPFEPIESVQPVPPLEPLQPVQPVPPVFVAPDTTAYDKIDVLSEYDRKMREFDEQITKVERQIEILEDKRSRLEDTRSTIEDRLEGDLNDATRERLDEMNDEINEKIDELNDEIDECSERIDEINEEREEYENEYVDEDIISEIHNLPGFSEFKEKEKYKEKYTDKEHADSNEINIEMIDEMKAKYAGISREQRESRRRYRRENKYNVNFCTGAKIDSFCCYRNRPQEEGYVESPDCMIADDPGLKKKWYAEQRHVTEIAHPYWVIIDLGDVKTFNYVQIFKAGISENKDWNMSAWRIEVCKSPIDRTNDVWVEFNRETDDKSTIYERQFEQVTGRYIRLLIDAPEADAKNKDGHVRIYGFKIKMRDETGEEITALTKDLMRNARIDACCHHNRNERPEHILSDNMKQKWCATRRQIDRVEMPHWVIIDFGESKTFNHLRMVKASESGQDNKWDRGKKKLDMSAWRFEVSDDKENWTEFNKETNDQSSIYIKTFEPVTGRYVRLWIDAPEADPNNKRGHVRIYDLRIEMLSDKLDDKSVTFDDIIAIAPFAKKETLDKLADKLTDMEISNFSKLKEVAQFLSPDAINKLILKAFEKDDFNAIFALSPYASKEIIEKIALDLDSELEFDKIKALAPFLGKEAITGIILSGDTIDMRKLRELAPFLGSALIDEIVQRMF